MFLPAAFAVVALLVGGPARAGGPGAVQQFETEAGEIHRAAPAQGAIGGCGARVDLDDPVIFAALSEDQVDSDESCRGLEAGKSCERQGPGSLAELRLAQGDAATEVAEGSVF